MLAIAMCSIAARAQYINHVFEYTPAPGQFINSSPYGTPTVAKNSIIGGVSGSMCLGAFGGYVVFGFQNPVENDPNNPYGVDFTIFGNPQKAYGYDRVTWSEPGVVYVMKDENGNGLPDDTWYELAGSDYYFSTTIKNYCITYTNPKQNVAVDVPWADNQGNTGVIVANTFHTQPYYPLADSFPQVNSDEYSLKGTFIEPHVDLSDPANVISWGRSFGYVDNQLRGSAPYTIPDNPYTKDVENSGGDAFDISWAVDSLGNYVDLDKIHFVKVMCGTQANMGAVGEISTEITGAVDVEPNAEITGELNVVVVKPLPDTISVSPYKLEAYVFNSGRIANDASITWVSSIDGVEVDANNLLTYSSGGNLTLTAKMASRPEIQTVLSVVLRSQTSVNTADAVNFVVYPNPASGYFSVKGVQSALVRIYGISGLLLGQVNNYSGEAIDVSILTAGVYIVEVQQNGRVAHVKLVLK